MLWPRAAATRPRGVKKSRDARRGARRLSAWGESAIPAWLALVEKGLHPLECSRIHHVAGHRTAGRLVGDLDAKLRLPIEERLAHGEGDARLGEDTVHESRRLGI